MNEALNMRMKDRDRLHIIRNSLAHRFTQIEAAKLLGLSHRQVQRICAAVRRGGDKEILHGLCGQRSNNQLNPEMLGQALSALHHPSWEGFGPVFAWEKLDEFYSIKLGKTTVRNLMILTNLWDVHRRGSKHRAWRERRSCVGMLTQLDGSDHDWFEGRGDRCVLLIYIDDATSAILYGEFVHVEDTLTLMRSTKIYLKKHGRPAAFYVDRDSIYKINRQASIEEDLRVEQPMTQFTRAMSELGIEVIAANSPQAKGRVERGFDTHQDRLVKELRLRGISTMEAGNQYLWNSYIPEHNARYAVEPASSANVHRPLLPNHNLDEILSLRTERAVFNDFTVRFQNRFFQILADQPVRVRPKDKLIVEVWLDGSTHLRFKERYLNFKPIEKKPYTPFYAARKKSAAARPLREPYIMPRNHPWRKFRLLGSPSFPPTSAALPK